MASCKISSPVLLHCKGVLFDMDGILISSIGSVERSWNRWSLLRGVDPERARRIAHGCRSIDTVAILRPDLDPAIENEIVEGFEMEDTDGVTVLPGVAELLASLARDRWTVVTSATEPLAWVRLRAGSIALPDRIVTSESVEEGKPHPAPYLAGAALLGLSPEECVVFEDAASGVQAGRAAGCTVVATTFSHSAESLAAAHYLIEDLTGVEAAALDGNRGLALRFTPLPL